MKKRLYSLFLPLLMLAVLLPGCQDNLLYSYTLDGVPDFSGEPYVILEDNQPDFNLSDGAKDAFEAYSDLDALGRCGPAYAKLGTELMPTEEREDIGQVKPSGWQSIRYGENEGTYLYNRCHLIGFQLSGENANEENLITGTRYLNVEGMLPFENMVADYIKETDHHVLYRVTPVFQGEELVARGVELEGWSLEDEGEGICFHVYAYNNQPGMEIDYATGDAWPVGQKETQDSAVGEESLHYVLNERTKKFHFPDCTGVASMGEQNRQDYVGTREWLIQQGYVPCGTCKP